PAKRPLLAVAIGGDSEQVAFDLSARSCCFRGFVAIGRDNEQVEFNFISEQAGFRLHQRAGLRLHLVTQERDSEKMRGDMEDSNLLNARYQNSPIRTFLIIIFISDGIEMTAKLGTYKKKVSEKC
ncbi:hypothetical protein V2J09_017844, partial [Rumex salicifolius]